MLYFKISVGCLNTEQIFFDDFVESVSLICSDFDYELIVGDKPEGRGTKELC